MSKQPHRRLMREKFARPRQHAGALLIHMHGAHKVSLLAFNPVHAVRTRYAR